MRKPFFYLLLWVAAGACHGSGPSNISLGDATKYVNNSGSTQWVNLPDGSQIKISDGTVIVLGTGFGKEGRDVDLDGEGMFEVRASAAGPFVVHTKNLVIQALGTKFRVDAVRSRPGEEVDLLEGRLRIVKSYHSDSDNEPEQLEAGDMLMINREIDLMEKEKMNGEEVDKAKAKF
jgi:ferric-dicitrate binding protein FerR (iron transport regulator)